MRKQIVVAAGEGAKAALQAHATFNDWQHSLLPEPAFFSLMTGQVSQTLFSEGAKGVPFKRCMTAATKVSGVVGQPGSLRSTFTTSSTA